MLSTSFILSAILFLPHVCADSQEILRAPKQSPLDDDFAKLVNDTIHTWNVPGLTIAVIDGDDIFAEGYGIATFPSTPVTPSTLFYAGSTSKAFTAAAISLLIDNSSLYEGINWDTPVSKLIGGDFVLEDEWATGHVTVEDILSHRSGMPRHDMSYGGHYDGHLAIPKDVVRALRHLPLTAEPRVRFQYCNMMFVTASHVVETLTGKWLGDFLKERIWDPLGMHGTYFSTPSALAAPENLATGYSYINNTYIPVRFMDLGAVSGAGSVISNVLDYSKWIHAHIHKLPPISRNGYRALATPRTLLPELPEEDSPYSGISAYSLGWEVQTYQGHQLLQHSGGMEAYGANVIYFPDIKYGVVAMGNTAGTSNVVEEILSWKLIDDKLETPKGKRFDWGFAGRKAFAELEKDYETALERYYPHLPDPPLPLSVPLKMYAGTYFHPAYRNVTLEVVDDVLAFNRLDVSFPVEGNFTHVSGDYFLTYAESSVAPSPRLKLAFPSEFRIGADGVPSAVGVGAEPEMGLEGRVWFERI